MKMKRSVPFVVDRDAVVVERINDRAQVTDHVSGERPLAVIIPEAGRGEVRVRVWDEVVGGHISLMSVHMVDCSPRLQLLAE